jgi:hypothetical protein
MKHKSLNPGMAIAFGAAIGAALGAATGHMAGWVAIGVAAGAAIALAGRNNFATTCKSSDEKPNPPSGTY